MSIVERATACAVALLGFLLLCGPVRADRPTCAQILAARDADRAAADIAKDFGTTRARVEACSRIEKQHEHLAAGRAAFYAHRADRGLAR
jgi:hypothetical protein